MMKKYIFSRIILLVFTCVVISIVGMDSENSLKEEIQAIANQNIKSVSICLGNSLTHLLETKNAKLAYPSYDFDEPAVRLIPLHIHDENGNRLFTNILLPYALLLADKCIIDIVLKYNNKKCTFDTARINFPFEYRFPKTSSFLRKVADKVESEHIIALEGMASDYKQKNSIDKAFFATTCQKKVEELSMQIATLKKSREFFMVGCAFLCIFIFFRCDWWSEREIFNF